MSGGRRPLSVGFWFSRGHSSVVFVLVWPARKIFYNITVTGVSVAVALIIGTLQLMSLLVDSLGLSGGPVAYLASLDLSAVGVIVTAGFIGMWVLALVVWRFGRIEERWTRRLQPTD